MVLRTAGGAAGSSTMQEQPAVNTLCNGQEHGAASGALRDLVADEEPRPPEVQQNAVVVLPETQECYRWVAFSLWDQSTFSSDGR
jgi:hypothetical protein